MSGPPERIYVSGAARGRRLLRLLGLVFSVMIVLGVALSLLWLEGCSLEGERRVEEVRVVRGSRVVLRDRVDRIRRLDEAGLRRWLGGLATARSVRRGPARLELRVDRRELLARVRAGLDRGGGDVVAPELSVASSASLPILKQALRNNCETAALSILLAARGVRRRQLDLQRQLPRSGPLDPGRTPSGGLLWGDPDLGYVGRADGGGSAGGYGTYEGPLRRLAARHGVVLDDIGGGSARRIYRRLLAGRPVLVWIGLTEGPYERWRTPEGKTVEANFGEHTVVLSGLRGGQLLVNDPLDGRRKTWSKSRFEELWPRLGRRALSVGGFPGAIDPRPTRSPEKPTQARGRALDGA